MRHAHLHALVPCFPLQQALLAEPFRRRRELLRQRFPAVTPDHPAEKSAAVAARFDHVRSIESEDGREAVEAFWQEAVESRCEGLMIKVRCLAAGRIPNSHTRETLMRRGLVCLVSSSTMARSWISTRSRTSPRLRANAVARAASLCRQLTSQVRAPLRTSSLAIWQTRQTGGVLIMGYTDKRTSAWLKLKKDYVAGLGDSLDLVPIGAWHGNGRKAQWWSPILLAVWDPDLEKLVAVCKCMSGFSDAFYKVSFSTAQRMFRPAGLMGYLFYITLGSQ